MSAQYPILDNRPINKWKVAELRDELKRRSLPTKGLKDELVRRLDEAIRYEREAVEAEEADNFDGESEPAGDFGYEKVESSGVEMTNETFEHCEIEVKTTVETVTTVTTVEIDDEQTKIDQVTSLEMEETIGTDPITVIEKQEVIDDPTTIDQGKALQQEESVATDPITMIDDPTKIDEGKAWEPEQTVGTKSSIMVVETAVVEAPTPLSNVPDEIVLPHITPSEGTLDNKNINHDGGVLETFEKGAVLMGEPSTLEASVESIVEVVDCKVHETLEEENIKIDNNEVEGMTDLPPEKAVESVEAKPESLRSSQMDADHSESYSSNKVYEVSHNLGFQVKSESFSNEILTINEKDELKENLTADNVKLEPEIVRPEMVLPSSIRDLPGDGIVHPSDDPVPQSNQTLGGETDDDKTKHLEFSENNNKKDEMAVDISVVDHNLENEAPPKVDYDDEPSAKDISPVSGLSPEQIEPSAETIIDVAASGKDKNPQDKNDFSKATDGADGELLEKVNFDQSSADDSMEEDTSEARLVDFDHNSSRVFEKTESNKDPCAGDGGRGDVIQHGIPSEKLEFSNDQKESVAASSEKRKFQDTAEAGDKELPKKQRRWNTESQEVPKSQSPGAILPTTPKASLLTVSTKPKLTSPNSNSLLDGEAPKERVVPPSQKTPTNSLRIDHFLRPFTLKAVQELLAKTGKVCSFWMDHIKTHCYVMYSSVEEAVETRNTVYNLQWPPNGGRNLVADFVDPEEVKSRIEAPSPSAAPSVNANTSAVKAQPPPHPAAPTHPRLNHEPQNPLSRQPPTVREPLPRAPSPVAEKPEPPIVTLDDLFRKTRSTPRIYYLPLSDEQVATKLARLKRDRR